MSLKSLSHWQTRHALGIDKEEAMPPDLAHRYQMALRTVLDSLAVALAGQVALALLAGGPGGTRAPARVRDRGRGLDPAADALGA